MTDGNSEALVRRTTGELAVSVVRLRTEGMLVDILERVWQSLPWMLRRVHPHSRTHFNIVLTKPYGVNALQP